MSRTEKLFVRVSVWQTALSAAGVFIGVVALYSAVASPDRGLRFCYCLIFDDCWLRDGRNEVAEPRPVEAAWPDFGEAGFRFRGPVTIPDITAHNVYYVKS